MRRRKRAGRAVMALILMLTALLADSRWRLVTTEYTVKSQRLPGSFDGFRIVQLSDLHGMEFGKQSSRLAEKVRAAEPDIIALTGDIADEKTDMAVVDALLEELCAIAPVYYVSGNHEWGSGRINELKMLLEKHGVTYLRNSHVSLERGGESITLAGVEDPNAWRDMPDPEQVLAECDSELYTVLLGHRNYWVERYPELEADLILCGHAHGGIVRLPVLGGLLGAHRELLPEYVDGVTVSGRYSMVVSRGLGNSIDIPRFLNNPEIVAVTLKKE